MDFVPPWSGCALDMVSLTAALSRCSDTNLEILGIVQAYPPARYKFIILRFLSISGIFLQKILCRLSAFSWTAMLHVSPLLFGIRSILLIIVKHETGAVLVKSAENWLGSTRESALSHVISCTTKPVATNHDLNTRWTTNDLLIWKVSRMMPGDVSSW